MYGGVLWRKIAILSKTSNEMARQKALESRSRLNSAPEGEGFERGGEFLLQGLSAGFLHRALPFLPGAPGIWILKNIGVKIFYYKIFL
jgi:hypothetical protein